MTLALSTKLIANIVTDIVDTLRINDMLSSDIETLLKEHYLSGNTSNMHKKHKSKKPSSLGKKRPPTPHQLNVSKAMAVLKEHFPEVAHRYRMGTGQFAAQMIRDDSLSLKDAVVGALKRYNDEKMPDLYDLTKTIEVSETHKSMKTEQISYEAYITTDGTPIASNDNVENKEEYVVTEEKREACVVTEDTYVAGERETRVVTEEDDISTKVKKSKKQKKKQNVSTKVKKSKKEKKKDSNKMNEDDDTESLETEEMNLYYYIDGPNLLDKIVLQHMKHNDSDYLVDTCTKNVYDFNDHTLCVGKLNANDELYLHY